MLLFIAIANWVLAYTLLYAAIKGDKATIDGTPLWKNPWLPFIAGIKGKPAGSTFTLPTTPSVPGAPPAGGAQTVNAGLSARLTPAVSRLANFLTGTVAAELI